MIENIFILGFSLFLIIKGATLATKYSSRIAQAFNLSKYVVGFIIVAVISILPEGLVAINSAIEGVPQLGLATLLGSNIADLTILFTIVILLTGKNIKVESRILKNSVIYPLILIIPIMLGFDGFYSRWEGIILILTGIIFYLMAFKDNTSPLEQVKVKSSEKYKNILLLLLSMAILLFGSHFIVISATKLASEIGVSMSLIGMFVIGLGTVMPELFFSLKSVKKNDDSLAIGDVLGTVLADCTVIIGIIALIKPFSFPTNIIHITGIFMVIAAFILFYFMKSDKTLTKKEGVFLLLFWIIFAFIEFTIN